MKTIKFKPIFGNENHIYILELIGKFNKMQVSYELKKKEARGVAKLEKDITQMEERINWLIEKENNK